MTGSACSVGGCETPVGWNGMCPKHATRVARHGDPHAFIAVQDRHHLRGSASPRWAGEDARYSGMHQRLRVTKGRASDHPCVECGAPASHWSYDHADPQERASELGAYSLDPDHYLPRCIPCHHRLDGSLGARKGRPIDQNLVVQLHAEGVGVNRMAGRLRVSPDRIRHLLDELGLPRLSSGYQGAKGPPRQTGPVKHGYGGYTNFGCRCDVCRNAANEYKRSLRKKRSSVATSYQGTGDR